MKQGVSSSSREVVKVIEEGSLGAEQLGMLGRMLDSPSIQNLPEWQKPEVPTANDKLLMVDLRIDPDGAVKHPGYAIWHGDAPESQMDLQSAQEAEHTKAVLRPVIDNIENLKGQRIGKNDTSRLACYPY